MRLCGISSRFQLLSPCVRQVAHALLTRPPLSHNHLHSEEIEPLCFVRLACVRHAASVHPEPGSNSLKKFCSFRIELAIVQSFRYIFRCFTVLRSLPIINNKKLFAATEICFKHFPLPMNESNWMLSIDFSLNLSRLFHCSVIKVLMCCCLSRQLLYVNIVIIVCQQLFEIFLLRSSSLASAWLSYHIQVSLSTSFFPFSKLFWPE